MTEHTVLDGYFYTKDDTWVRKTETGSIRFGITDYAQQKLKRIEYLSLPDVGEKVGQFEALGEIESMKAVSELISPLTGQVKAVNGQATDTPSLVNQRPFETGWLLELDCEDFGAQTRALMDAAAYRAYRGQ
ncbi:MAG: glycine cleavage system protein H [Clostridiales bacterium]|nr:glycine cleavage system protein H [Clostridiales bacterium]